MTHDELLSIQSHSEQDAVFLHQVTAQLSCELEHIRPDFCHAKITIPQQIIASVYHEAARSQQASTQTYGFQHGAVPIEYIKQNFKENLVEHLKEFLLKYCVVNFLYEYIREQKIVVAGEPRLQDMYLDPALGASFTFELSIFPDLSIYDWKYFPFRAPKRKNYKDLDRQVESFINDEIERAKHFASETLLIGDWVNFSIELINPNNEPLIPQFEQKYWFKLSEDETESPLRMLFTGKKVGDTFITNHRSLQTYFSDVIDSNYNFKIDILNTLAGNYICFDQFKRTFRVKTNKDLHKKLIEVFSYRNDVSQRHATVEDAFSTLFAKHRFTIPNYLVLRQQKILIASMQHNPDYHVYRAQKNFEDHVRKLALKQCMELIFIDKLAYYENLSVSDEDIKGYLNLINRPRVKDFVYFELPSCKVQGQEVPITHEEMKRTCLREKTINYVLYHLTKQ